MWLPTAVLGLALQAVLQFPASGDPKAHAEFLLGVQSLHGSAYDDAAAHFRAAERIDPDFVLAFWGEAMTFNHPFWNQQDIGGARRALLKLAPTRAARAAKAKTPRERAYLNAVEILFGDGDRDSRDFAFAEAMRKVAFDNPDDYEAAAFYVLAMLSARRIGDTTYLQTQAAAAAILNSILGKYPGHPGALHYLMHAYDDPEHAPLALDAARRYEKVPVTDANFHAIHMPSHIYAQLGMWDDVVRLNQKALDASDRAGKRDYHSLEFLQYAEMQLGRYDNVRRSLKGNPPVLAARFAIETREWNVLAAYPENDRTSELAFARGLAALASDGVSNAKRYSSTLDAIRREDLTAMRRNHAASVELLNMLLASRIAFAEKRFDDAEKLAATAVKFEVKLDVPAELNGIVKPAAEFYGELLLELGKSDDAAVQFSAALRQRPGRRLSLEGLARSRPRGAADQDAGDRSYRANGFGRS